MCLTPKLMILLFQFRVEVVIHLSRWIASYFLLPPVLFNQRRDLNSEEWYTRRPLGSLPSAVFWEVINTILQPQAKLCIHEKNCFIPSFASSFRTVVPEVRCQSQSVGVWEESTRQEEEAVSFLRPGNYHSVFWWSDGHNTHSDSRRGRELTSRWKECHSTSSKGPFVGASCHIPPSPMSWST